MIRSDTELCEREIRVVRTRPAVIPVVLDPEADPDRDRKVLPAFRTVGAGTRPRVRATAARNSPGR